MFQTEFLVPILPSSPVRYFCLQKKIPLVFNGHFPPSKNYVGRGAAVGIGPRAMATILISSSPKLWCSILQHPWGTTPPFPNYRTTLCIHCNVCFGPLNILLPHVSTFGDDLVRVGILKHEPLLANSNLIHKCRHKHCYRSLKTFSCCKPIEQANKDEAQG